jgi:hypothetical protein
MITSNHIHLLIKDTGPNVIAKSMQLIAGTHGALSGGTAPVEDLGSGLLLM